MNKMLKIGLIAGLVSISAEAAVSSLTKVTKVMTYPGVAVIGVSTNISGCTFANKKYVILDTTTTNGRSVYSAALTAFTTGAKVQVAHSGCRSWWGATVPKMYRLDMLK